MARIGKTAEDIKESAERARGADAVRVTVHRDGLARSAEVEIIGPGAYDEWVPCFAAAVRLDGDAEAGRAGVVLTFAGGERVEIGKPRGGLDRDGLRAVLQEALEASGGPAPATSPWQPGDPEPPNAAPFYVHAPVPGPDPWATACGRRVPRSALAWPGGAKPDCPACRVECGLEEEAPEPVFTTARISGVGASPAAGTVAHDEGPGPILTGPYFYPPLPRDPGA